MRTPKQKERAVVIAGNIVRLLGRLSTATSKGEKQILTKDINDCFIYQGWTYNPERIAEERAEQAELDALDRSFCKTCWEYKSQ